MIYDFKKEEAISVLTIRIKNLVEVLSDLAGNHDANMNATDALTFQRLAVIRADLDSIAAVTGADRVQYDREAKKYHWNPKDSGPDGQWRAEGYGHESTNWKGYYLQVRAKAGKFPDVEWLIHKDGECVLHDIVFRTPFVNPLEEAKSAVLLAVKGITDK